MSFLFLAVNNNRTCTEGLTEDDATKIALTEQFRSFFKPTHILNQESRDES
jgi:hypothetical protein